MKKFWITFSICFYCGCIPAIFSQFGKVDYLPSVDKKLFRFGFYLGVNQNDFKIDYFKNSIDANVVVAAKTGFNVGLIADMRLHKNINIRIEPGLMTNTKTLSFTHLTSDVDKIREANSTFLHIPLLIKFSSNRWKNIRPYVIGGFAYDHNFTSNQNNVNDNSSGEFRMKTSNLMYEIGVGIDLYFYFFKLSPSIRGIFAINNELKYDKDPNSNWTAPIEYFTTRGIFINFTFE